MEIGPPEPAVQVAQQDAFGQQQRPLLGEIGLVELQHQRHPVNVEAVRLQVGLQVLEREDVGLAHGGGIGDEDDAVGPLQEHFPGRIVRGPAGDGVDPDLHVDTLDVVQAEGQKVEEQGLVAVGVDGQELGVHPLPQVVVDVDQIGGLAGRSRPVIDDLELNQPAACVDERHLSDPVEAQGCSHSSTGRRRPRRLQAANVIPGPSKFYLYQYQSIMPIDRSPGACSARN
ncbi:MAG: hypothetical protein R6V84_05935 [Desulfobacterales bacterium]